MKISLSWLFDHIDADWRKIDVQNLVNQFNLKTAEIEGFEKISIDPKQFTVVLVESVGNQVDAFSPELGKKFSLPLRDDAKVGEYYFINTSECRWASGADFKSIKDGLLPALYFDSDAAAAKWKDKVDLEDYIFEVDNKSLTHRPDMWGHRGFAREIAALIDLEMLPESNFLADIPVKELSDKFTGDDKNPISTKIKTKNCDRLATLYVGKAANLPSQLWMAIRLFRCDARAINNFVDITNYVMFDIGHPIHVFDANRVESKSLVIRQAKDGEQMKLLDGTDLKLVAEDMVIFDGKVATSLVGIKGGFGSGSSDATESLLLESGGYDATTIRRSSARHKVRTDASARFEKTLDPNQNVSAIERFIKLQQEVEPDLLIESPIVSLGSKVEPKLAEITHDFIESKLGIKIEPSFVVNSLEKIGFGVQIAQDKYLVTIPTWRCVKDVTTPEDILEEISRMWGYDKIEPVLPSKAMQPGSLDATFRVREIKRALANAAAMHEVRNYPFYDEEFLQQIKWQPSQAVEVKNPVSENWRRLVTSLIPHLCKSILQNIHTRSEFSFFEWGRIWYPKDKKNAIEARTLSGLFYKNSKLDFYDAKNNLEKLFSALNLEVTWEKPSGNIPVWFHPHQTANLVCEGKQIGMAGNLGSGWMREVAEGDAFAFEIDGEFLLGHEVREPSYEKSSRYQPISLDVSLLTPLGITVADLQNRIKKIDSRIYKVELVDSFQKDDWVDKKALTFRYHFVDPEKTLTGEEIAVIQQQVEHAMQKGGAQVR